MNKRQALGQEGERKARKFLERKGYQILHQNYRFGRGEIDLICKDKNTFVFVEVKARNSREFGDGAEAVNLKKREKLIATAYAYLKASKMETLPFRFDIISILSDAKNKEEITHLTGAFP